MYSLIFCIIFMLIGYYLGRIETDKKWWDRPVCRLDEDWLKTQESQVDFVIEQSKKHKCPIVICGDVFHKPQVPDFLKNMLIDKFYYSNDVYVIAGNHDLPYHSWENFNDSSLAVLFNGITVFPPNFGSFSDFGRPMIQTSPDPIIFIHEPIFASEQDCPPNMKARTAEQVLAAYPDAKWILCGDIHRGYSYKQQGRHLIMAGCLNRQASNFKDYEPKIWLVDTDKELIEEILVPDDVNMITDDHITEKNAREDRISAFVSLIRESKSVSLDFDHNVRQAILERTDMSESTINVIEELMI
jgi:predicted phosphodiesterase